MPHLAQYKQWRDEGAEQARREFEFDYSIPPELKPLYVRTFIKGYIRGRVMQWRLEQEINIQVEKLRSDLDNENETR